MNRLSSETSPYLRQHADNPVNWYPWSQEAFATAGELDRPVMLSVGYSSCHWCHVMADESFEDEQTAAELNSRFVSVKVDREERPDVDAVYMEAVQALSGRGGWPMTVFLTPDRRPFFAGTYYPARDMHGMPSFRRVLDAVHDAWVNRRSEVEGQADALLDAVSRLASVPEGVLQLDQPTSVQTSRAGAAKALESAASELRARFEPAWGGFSPAPKVPHPTLLELCLQHHRLSGEEASLSMATRTLDAMASGGMYDQLGGGFHRYSTDDSWTVPHFEKMLYDQAGMVRAYLHAWQATGERRWMAVVEETVGYVLRDLASGSGGLY
ncbi:MAG: thioredoxin domain-containing protein, partial [Acidimicrobiales bacterium]